jgi:hypothetical protein
LYLFSQQWQIPARGQTDNLKFIRKLLDHIQNISSDGPGGTQYRQSFQKIVLIEQEFNSGLNNKAFG